MASILEALMNAEINFDNSKKLPLCFTLAKDQLHNAIILLEKGYDSSEEVEPLLEKYGNVDAVPDKE
jgi:hypothetical protein